MVDQEQVKRDADVLKLVKKFAADNGLDSLAGNADKAQEHLEKTYNLISMGDYASLFHDLTGAPTIEFPIEEGNCGTKDDMYLENSRRRGGNLAYVVSKKADEISGGAEEAKRIGIVPNCVYMLY